MVIIQDGVQNGRRFDILAYFERYHPSKTSKYHQIRCHIKGNTIFYLLIPNLKGFNPFASEAVYTRNFFSTACRTACKHAFRFLRVLPEAVSTRHSWLWQTLDDVYTRRCFSESEGTTLRCPRTKGTAVSEWVNGMEWVNGFLPNPFIHDLFCWSSRHTFVKTDL